MTRRSTTRFITLLDHSPITWKTKQGHVSLYSVKDEYRFMATVTRDVPWLKYLLTKLGVSHPQPLQFYCDNQTALQIVVNYVFQEHTKNTLNLIIMLSVKNSNVV